MKRKTQDVRRKTRGVRRNAPRGHCLSELWRLVRDSCQSISPGGSRGLLNDRAAGVFMTYGSGSGGRQRVTGLGSALATMVLLIGSGAAYAGAAELPVTRILPEPAVQGSWDDFPISVSLDGDTLAFGSPFSGVSWLQPGLGGLLRRGEDGWHFLSRLYLRQPNEEMLGWSVVLKGRMLVRRSVLRAQRPWRRVDFPRCQRGGRLEPVDSGRAAAGPRRCAGPTWGDSLLSTAARLPWRAPRLCCSWSTPAWLGIGASGPSRSSNPREDGATWASARSSSRAGRSPWGLRPAVSWARTRAQSTCSWTPAWALIGAGSTRSS